jgi:hypothetical protein
MSGINEFIHNNAKWLLILLFTAGITYSKFENLEGVEERFNDKIVIIEEEFEKNLEVVEERLNKKIKIIAENEDKIHKLELRIVKLETKKE